MTDYICPECAQGKHVNCTGEAWDTEKDAPTACACSHKTAGLITTKHARRDPSLTEIEHDETGEIESVLLGQSVVEVIGDHLRLSGGTMIRVVPNDGGCSCGSGDYHLETLNRVENIITKVEFDYRPTGDRTGRQNSKDAGYYRIFVLAGEERINLLQVNGDDGNGYYGTGFRLLIREVAE